MSSEQTYAFSVQSQTLAVPASTAANPGLQPVRVTTSPYNGTYRFLNPNAYIVWVGWGPNATTAQANAIKPSSGSSANSLPIGPQTIEVFNLGPNGNGDMFFSAVADSASPSSGSVVYVTSGTGV